MVGVIKIVSAEPTYSILGNFIDSIDLDTYVQDLLNDESDDVDLNIMMNNILGEQNDNPVIPEVEISMSEASETESQVLDRLVNNLLANNVSEIQQDLVVSRDVTPVARVQTNNVVQRSDRENNGNNRNFNTNLLDVVSSEVPNDLLVSDIAYLLLKIV
jgi:hypothetical protein